MITITQAQQAVRNFHVKHRFKLDLLWKDTRVPITDPSRLDIRGHEWQKTGMERLHMVVSEAGELAEAWHDKDIVALADALGDLLYVVLGSAVAAGIDLQSVFEEVHRSNMTKDTHSGRTELHPKGPNYSPPDMVRVMREQGLL